MIGLDDFRSLGLALAIGLLIGLEREWTRAQQQRKRFISGARTFAIVGLTGGLVGVIEPVVGWLTVMGFLAVSIIIVGGYTVEAFKTEHIGATTEFALLGTYILGVLASREDHYPAAAAAGITVAVLLNMKLDIQRWVSALKPNEVEAALRFLIISVVILPILPEQDMGPYGALNPRQLWLMVVLISGMSFTGYILMRVFGTTRGIVLTGLVGGLASSTAATLSLARFSKTQPEAGNAFTVGIIVANLVMLARIAVLLSLFSVPILLMLWPVLLAAGLTGLAALVVLRARSSPMGTVELNIENPMELRQAILFGAILGATLLASHFISEQTGDLGLVAVGTASGLADVDAMTLSASRLASRGDIGLLVAASAVLAAVLSNTIVKAALTWMRGNVPTARGVSFTFLAMLVVGALVFSQIIR